MTKKKKKSILLPFGRGLCAAQTSPEARFQNHFNYNNSMQNPVRKLCCPKCKRKVTNLYFRIGSFIKYVRKTFQKTNISYPLVRTRTCLYQEVTNVSFSEEFGNILNEYSYSFSNFLCLKAQSSLQG